MSVKKRKNTRKWIGFCILAVAVAGAAAILFLRPVPTTYESVEAKTGDITTYYSFSGNVETKNRQTVISDRALQVSEIEVEEGDMVEEGDVLLRTTAGEKIKAKINGEVASIDVEEDVQVMAGVPLLEVVDYNDLEIKVRVDEYDISAIEKDKEATVIISATGQELKGIISSMSKEGEISNGVTFFTATIDLAKDSNLKIGMSAEVTLISDKVTGVVTLPMYVIQFYDDNTPYVFKEGPNGTPVKTEITTGINDGMTVEVKEGVSTGETIFYEKAEATGGMFQRRPGNTNDVSGGSD